MTSGFAQPIVQALSWFFDLKEDDLWGCVKSNPECAIFPHDGTMDLMGLSGSIRSGVILDHLLFVTGAASYGWGYESCRPAGSSALATTSLTTNGDTANFSDEVPVCPTVTKLMHNGTLNIGNETTIWIDMKSPWGGANYTQSTIYIGHFILEAKPIEPVTTTSTPVPASTSSTPSTTSIPSTSSVVTSASSSNSTTSDTSTTILSILDGINDSSSTSSGIGGGPEANVSNSSSDTMQSKLPGIVGGTVAGICVIFILLFFLWRRHQHRKRLIADAVAFDEQDPWSPYQITNPPSSGYGHGILYAGGKNRPPSSAPEPIHSQEGLLGGAVYPSTPSTQEGHAPEMRSANEVSQAQYNVSSGGRPISPATTAGGLPAYDTYMNAPLVTFRRHLAMVPDVGEEEIVNDSLHEWAEGNRDFVPPHLERRLRAGGHVPGSNPSELSPENWLTGFGVTRYELAGLQELYERENTFRVL
ncbi:hypothetical protein M408DRAFT_326896 [Serendipita vermifera MAFF 305830]|uniref:Uncharacterized protein n=1 Tax=Serendipita vermifera MAFF 305830 TaxID=933852 RepID=A0A0C3BLD6_SERVB|nr:hypothetical protein M408DRAFT_326896 [Serendipita vermifera MAFF 305830]